MTEYASLLMGGAFGLAGFLAILVRMRRREQSDLHKAERVATGSSR